MANINKILQSIKPALIGSGIGFGVPTSLYLANKLYDVSQKAGNIEDTLENIKTRTLPMALGASLLGGLAGSGIYSNMNEDSESYPRRGTNYGTSMQGLGRRPLFPKFNNLHEDKINEILKKEATSKALAIGLGSALPTAAFGTYFSKDIINKLFEDTDKELNMGELGANVAHIGLPLVAGAIGAGTGLTGSAIAEKYSNLKDIYKNILRDYLSEDNNE